MQGRKKDEYVNFRDNIATNLDNDVVESLFKSLNHMYQNFMKKFNNWRMMYALMMRIPRSLKVS